MPSSPSILRQLVQLALPIIGLNLLNVLALTVDTAMCGRLPNADVALQGLGYAGQLQFLLLVAMMGLSIGAVALVARAHGAARSATDPATRAKQVRRVEHIMQQSALLTVLLGVAMAVCANIAAEPFLRLLGASDAATTEGLRYLRPLLIGTVFYYLSILFAAVLRGIGNTLLPFLVALGSNVLNVVVNYGLILGNFGLPSLGVQGAAIGTVISYAIGTFTLMAILNRRGIGPRGERAKLAIRPKPLDWDLAETFRRIGAPAALDLFLINAAFLTIVGMLGRIDQEAVAAHGIGLRIQALAFIPGMSIAQATGAMVGQALGARSTLQAREVTRASVALCVSLMSILAVGIVLGSPSIVALFGVDGGTNLHDLSVTWIDLLGYGMPIVGVYISLVGALRGAGATTLSLRINAWGTLAFQIPLSWLLGFPLGLGPLGIWLAFPLSFVLKAAWAGIVYRSDNWTRSGAAV